jgi:hypothetical protein
MCFSMTGEIIQDAVKYLGSLTPEDYAAIGLVAFYVGVSCAGIYKHIISGEQGNWKADPDEKKIETDLIE